MTNLLTTLTELGGRFKADAAHIPGNPLEYKLALVPSRDMSIVEKIVGRAPAKVLQVTNTIITEVEEEFPVKVDIAFLGKWVRSLTSGLVDPADPKKLVDPFTEDPIGGMPVADRIVAPLVNGQGLPIAGSTQLNTDLPPKSLMQSDTQPLGDVPGVPEALGRIVGTVTQVIKRLKEIPEQLDVRISVRWRVVELGADSSERPATGVGVATGSPLGAFSAMTTGEILLPSAVFPAVPPPGLNDPAALVAHIRLPVFFSELRVGTPEFVTLRLRASVRLGAAGIETSWIELPAFDLPIPTIPIPTIVVLCEHENFAGRKLVVVPSGAHVGTALHQAAQVMRSLQQVLGVTDGALTFLRFLDAAAFGGSLPAIAAAVLKSIVASPGQTIIVSNLELSRLDTPNLEFVPGWTVFGVNVGRVTANHIASSVIVVGRPGTTVIFGQQGGWPARETLTPLKIEIGQNQLACVVSSLAPPNRSLTQGTAFDQNDPASFTTTVFGGAIKTFSPKQNEDQICSIAITCPPARLIPAL